MSFQLARLFQPEVFWSLLFLFIFGYVIVAAIHQSLLGVACKTDCARCGSHRWRGSFRIFFFTDFFQKGLYSHNMTCRACGHEQRNIFQNKSLKQMKECFNR